MGGALRADYKRCSRCGYVLHLTYFSFKQDGRRTRQSRCRVCMAELARVYYLRDPASYKARAAAARQVTERLPA